MKTKMTFNQCVPVLLMVLGTVAILFAVIRLLAMDQALSTGVIPEEPPGLTPYIDHPIISILHLLPGILFMLLGPLQFTSSIRNRWPSAHRWSGRLFVLSGLITAISAIAMAILFPVIVNHFTTAANLTFGGALFIALIIAFHAIKNRDITRHRAWMIRAYAIGLSVATMRIFFGGVFVIFGEFNDAYLPSLVWLTFLLHIAIAELILARKKQHHYAATEVA